MPGEPTRTINAAEIAGRPLRYFDLVMAAFVTILLLSNVVGAGKRAVVDLPFIGPWPFGAGILFFPLSSVIGVARIAGRPATAVTDGERVTPCHRRCVPRWVPTSAAGGR